MGDGPGKYRREEIDACLNCRRPASSCGSCSGPTVERKPIKQPARRKGYPPNIKARALALVGTGYTYQQAADAVGATKAAVSTWVQLQKKRAG